MKSYSHKKWILIILPLIYLVLSAIFIKGLKQFYISNLDPTYEYLMNAVSIASGHFRIGIDEHPGIPTKIFASIIIWIQHFFTGKDLLYKDVLTHPEQYLFTCSITLSILLSLVVYYSGVYVYNSSKDLFTAILFQSSFLIYEDTLKHTILLSAESFITIISIFFMAYLYVNTIESKKGDKHTSTKNILFLGLLTAVLITTKIYCFPIALMVVCFLKGLKNMLLYLVSTFICSSLLLFPLYSQLRYWLGSIKNIILHSGPYGQGEGRFLDASQYVNNIVDIFCANYIFTAVFIIVLFVIIILLYRYKEDKHMDRDFFPIAGILVFMTVFVLLIAKQYKVNCLNPLTNRVYVITKHYYFIILFSSFPVAMTLAGRVILDIVYVRPLNTYIKAFMYSGLSVLILLGIKRTYNSCSQSESVTLAKTTAFINQWQATPLVIVSDGGEHVRNEPALFFGSYFSDKQDMYIYLEYLKKLYPDTYIYSIGWEDTLTFWNQEVTISDILNKYGKAIVYVSGADSLEEQATLKRICDASKENNSVTYKKIYTSDNKYEDIYLIQYDKTCHYIRP